jgi:hypothetical protein
MDLIIKRKGLVNGIRFEIKDTNTVRIWKPDELSFVEFKDRCDCIVKYLIDEAIFDKKNCKVEVVT